VITYSRISSSKCPYCMMIAPDEFVSATVVGILAGAQLTTSTAYEFGPV
jgi:hypothetical protein